MLKRVAPWSWAAFVAGMLTLAICGVVSGYPAGTGEGQTRLTTGLIVIALGAIIAGGTFLGLRARALARTRALRSRFPEALLLTIRKTPDLENQILILRATTPGDNVYRGILGFYSSLVIDASGVSLWSGGPSNLTEFLAVPAERVKELTTSDGAHGLVLAVIVSSPTVPITLPVWLVQPSRVGFPRLADDDIRYAVDTAQAKLQSG